MWRILKRKLLEARKLTSYFSYALGEIIIIAIGILFALYLNNWNQNKSNNRKEIRYYRELEVQLREDLRILNEESSYNQFYFSQFQYAAKLIESNTNSERDTIGEIALNMLRYSDFRRKSNIYQTLINSGELIILQNHEITANLQNLEEVYNYINRLEENHSTIILSHIIPDLKETLQFNPIRVLKPELFFSTQFKNDFDILIGLMQEKSDAYNQAVDLIQDIINFIDQELVSD